MDNNSNLVNTADATAVPNDIKLGETAYARGMKLTGTQEIYVEGTTLHVPEGWINVHVVGT